MHYGDYAYPQRSHTVPGLAAGKVLWFKARIVDRLGNVGPWSQWTRGMASDDAGPILDYIAGQIGETELGKDVLEKSIMPPRKPSWMMRDEKFRVR